MTEIVVLGILGIAGILYLFCQEFRKENNVPLYYFCFFILSLCLPVLAHTSYLGVNATYNSSAPTGEGNLITFYENIDTTILYVWLTIAAILAVIIFGRFMQSTITENTKKMENVKEDKYER